MLCYEINVQCIIMNKILIEFLNSVTEEAEILMLCYECPKVFCTSCMNNAMEINYKAEALSVNCKAF